MSGTTGVVVWVVLALVLVALETVTVAFIGIYLAVGALCAAVVAALDGALWLQLVVFAVVSASTLYLTRPALRSRFINAPLVPSNVPALVGRRGVVVVAIPAGTGRRGQVQVGDRGLERRSTEETPSRSGRRSRSWRSRGRGPRPARRRRLTTVSA